MPIKYETATKLKSSWLLQNILHTLRGATVIVLVVLTALLRKYNKHAILSKYNKHVLSGEYNQHIELSATVSTASSQWVSTTS